MMLLKAALLISLPAVRTTACSNVEFDQCGGSNFTGDTCCPDYDVCTYVNSFFSQCQDKDLCLVAPYGQCGGMDQHQPPRPWTPANHHPTCCPPSFYCSPQNPYFSQCLYNTTANTTCAAGHAQCGGKGWTGKTCCIPGFSCESRNEYYSGCEPMPLCTNARFGQCGGIDADGLPWTPANHHSDCCPENFYCSYVNADYSQCKSNSSSVVLTTVEEEKALK